MKINVVADPEMINNVGKNLFNLGFKSDKVFELVIDEDLSSMYPSIIINHRLSLDNQIGKLIIKKKYMLSDTEAEDLKRKIIKILNKFDYKFTTEIKDQDKRKLSVDELAALNRYYELDEDEVDVLMTSLIAKDYVATGEKFLGLPSVKDFI